MRLAQLALLLATGFVCASMLDALLNSRTAEGFAWVNHDVANVLYLGKRMLAGQRLYVDLAEANPPTIFFVAELLAGVSALTHVSLLQLFHACVMLLAVFGVWQIQSVFARAKRPLSLILVGGAFLLVLSGSGLPGDERVSYAFGQREQLFALTFIPYLFWRLSGEPPRFGSFTLTALVGLFAGMKPHFVVLVAGLEFVCALDNRSTLRRVWPVLIGAASLPWFLLLATCPQSVVALIDETIPLHTRGAYSYFNQPFSLFLRSPEHGWVVTYVVAIGYFLWSGARPSSRALRCILTLPPVAYALIVEQHKFWEYHVIVLVSLLAVLSYYLGAVLVERLPRERARPLFGLLLAALALQNWRALGELRAMTRDWKAGLGVEARLLKIAPLLEGRKRVLYYSTSISHMRLALLLDQISIGRWSHQLLYPALVRDQNLARRQRALDQYCVEQRRLIESEKPDAIVFHSARQGLTATDPELLEVLTNRCRVIPEQYSLRVIADVPEATVFVRQ